MHLHAASLFAFLAVHADDSKTVYGLTHKEFTLHDSDRRLKGAGEVSRGCGIRTKFLTRHREEGWARPGRAVPSAPSRPPPHPLPSPPPAPGPTGQMARA